MLHIIRQLITRIIQDKKIIKRLIYLLLLKDESVVNVGGVNSSYCSSRILSDLITDASGAASASSNEIETDSSVKKWKIFLI